MENPSSGRFLIVGSDDTTSFINVEQIRVIEKPASGTKMKLHFSENHTVELEGQVALDFLNYLSSSRQLILSKKD
ncbi:MAG: hypothetical protein ABI824_19255 [Acidobacteriota bacterium]